jgi:SAM-dependent methyltransferase
MIKVLQDWNEVGTAITALRMAGLPLHSDPPKCWDFYNLQELLRSSGLIIDSGASLVDLGCGPSRAGCATLHFLYAAGFRTLVGIDLHVPIYARIGAALEGMIRFRNPWPYRIVQGDLANTRLNAGSVDVVTLVSVIEHGVDVDSAFQEVARILRPGGIAYVSTDYWEAGIVQAVDSARSGSRTSPSLPWKIFDRAQIEELVATAARNGLSLAQEASVPRCKDKVVYWKGVQYTFIALVFRKSI